MDALQTTLDDHPTEAEAKVRDALAGQGFGILTEIDVAATLKAKLDVDRPPCKILGACNPTLADRALQLEPGFALLMPCNVVLTEAGDGGTAVAIADPRTMVGPTPGPELAALADEAAERLGAALASLHP